MNYNKRLGFTLVELIVVITVLAILGTIGFVSFQGYTRDARDSKRIADLQGISKGFSSYAIRVGLFPKPTNAVEVRDNGTVVAYQGYATENILDDIGYSNGGLDPKDNNNYTYYTTADYEQHQVMGLLESPSDITPIVSLDNSGANRYPYVAGDKIGTFTDTSNRPIQQVQSIIDDGYIDVGTSFTTYRGHFSNTRIIEGTRSIFSPLSDLIAVKGYKPEGIVFKVRENCGFGLNADYNYYGGPHNGKINNNQFAFAAIKGDGGLEVWGYENNGGDVVDGGNYTGKPGGTGWSKIYSAGRSFIALKDDGTIGVWGRDIDVSDAPTGDGFVKIASNYHAAAGLKDDGTIVSWGDDGYGGAQVDVGTDTAHPKDSGYVDIYSAHVGFVGMKEDGSLQPWGDDDLWTSYPTGTGFVSVHSTNQAFAAMKPDGSIDAWGHSSYGGTGEPTDNGYVYVYGTDRAFAAIKGNGSITAWGNSSYGGTGAPTGTGYVTIVANEDAFAALKYDGSIDAWGNATYGGSGEPTGTGFTKIVTTGHGFAALKNDGSIEGWGEINDAGDPNVAPSGNNFQDIFPGHHTYIALTTTGSLTLWGDDSDGNFISPPTDGGYVNVVFNDGGYVAIKANGSLSGFGLSWAGGNDAPTGSGYDQINGTPVTPVQNCAYGL